MGVEAEVGDQGGGGGERGGGDRRRGEEREGGVILSPQRENSDFVYSWRIGAMASMEGDLTMLPESNLLSRQHPWCK